jgi:hypothetical protein
MGTERYRIIIEACFPKLQVRSIAPASEGWDSVAFEVNGDYIFRFPKRPDIDFVGLLDDCGADLTERVLAAYAGDIDATFRSRMGFYLHTLPFNDILFGAATGDAELVAQGVAGVKRSMRGLIAD